MLGFRLNKLGAAMRNNRPLVALRFDDPTRSLDSRITFTRGSQATYFDSTGTLQTVGNNVARSNAFQDYNPSTLAPLGFLIEEQRTNLFLRSDEFDNASWGKANCTITANSVTSPAGTITADTLTTTAAGGAINQTTQSFTAGSTVTFAVFAKKNTSNFMRFEIGGLVNCWFNLNTGTTATNSAGSGNVLFSSKSIQAINNGWYRCSVTVTTAVVTTLGVLLFATDTDNNTSSINSSVYLWGAQAEVGAFATSYIATTTAAATRLADSASITGANFSSWFNATEGTLVAFGTRGVDTDATLACFSIDATTADRMQLHSTTSSEYRATVRTGNVEQAALVLTSSTNLPKMAFAYAVNDFAACINGGTVATDVAGSLAAHNRLTIGARSDGDIIWNGWISQICYYRARLANATLQSVTT